MTGKTGRYRQCVPNIHLANGVIYFLICQMSPQMPVFMFAVAVP